MRQILADYALALHRMNRKAEARAYERRVKNILRASAEADVTMYTVDINELLRQRQ